MSTDQHNSMTNQTSHTDLAHSDAQAAGSFRTPIRVLLADDHPAVRLGVRKLINDQPDMVVVAEARSADEALSYLEQGDDVAVLDYHLGGVRDGLWATRRLKRQQGAPRVLIYSAFADSALGVAALVAGADGLLGKGSLGEELCIAIRRLAGGRQYLPAIPLSVAQVMRSHLSPSDQAIFAMLQADVPPDEIVERLGIGPDELDDRREIMLLALAPAAPSVQGNAYAPLDYERPRRRSGHGVA
jgi:DNA-binding NarL/FixJ family response regulator